MFGAKHRVNGVHVFLGSVAAKLAAIQADSVKVFNTELRCPFLEIIESCVFLIAEPLLRIQEKHRHRGATNRVVSLWAERDGKPVLPAALDVLWVNQGVCFINDRHEKLIVARAGAEFRYEGP